MAEIGIVAIGRNEGERLHSCLSSACGRGYAVVYVDSGSTDGSCELARSLGAEVVDLDLSIPFTAARARNAGSERLLELDPGVSFIQFVDGDCELQAGWFEVAQEALKRHDGWAAVVGRLRERHPHQTLYNRLAHVEWQNLSPGESTYFGGIAMVRVAPFLEVGRFNSAIIAGEEPELSLRLRQRGWSIHVLPAEMAVHDINMTRFAQWWKRTLRGGHAYSEGFRRHGRGPERFRLRKLIAIMTWGLILPILALGLAWPTRGLSLGVIGLLYALQIVRTVGHHRRRGIGGGDAWLGAAANVLSTFPMAIGVMQYWRDRLLNRDAQIIEYKGL